MPPTAAITLAPLQPEDLDACAAIAKAAPDPWRREDLQAALQNPRCLCLAAQWHGKVAGFACFSLLEGEAELQMLVTHPAHTRQGVARALLARGLQEMKSRGAHRCLLELRRGNTAAYALYEGMGFQTLARRPAMYALPTEDGLLMEKIL